MAFDHVEITAGQHTESPIPVPSPVRTKKRFPSRYASAIQLFAKYESTWTETQPYAGPVRSSVLVLLLMLVRLPAV
jgi:hypothetical protein